MARKKKNGSAGEGILYIFYIAIVVLVYVVMVIVAVVPIIFIFGFLTNYGRAEQDKKEIAGDCSDFWLSNEEKDEFESVHAEHSRVADIVISAKNKAVRAGISKNKDGQFSARSKIGKEVRATFARYGEDLVQLNDDYDSIRYLPLQRWLDFDKAIKKYKAYSYAIISYVLLTIGYGYYLGKSTLSEMYAPYSNLLNNLIAVFMDEYEDIPMIGGDVTIITVATIGSIVVFLLAYNFLSSSASAFSPMPPLVSASNLNDF